MEILCVSLRRNVSFVTGPFVFSGATACSHSKRLKPVSYDMSVCELPPELESHPGNAVRA